MEDGNQFGFVNQPASSLAMVQAKLSPSKVDVPLPNSSIRTKEFLPAFLKIRDASSISAMNVEIPSY